MVYVIQNALILSGEMLMDVLPQPNRFSHTQMKISNKTVRYAYLGKWALWASEEPRTVR